LIEQGSCGLCQGRKHDLRLKLPDRRILRCQSCGIIFSDLIWQPEKVRALYETPDFFAGAYWRWDGQSALDDLDAPAYRSALVTAKNILGSGGLVLDVGCGLGGFMAQAQMMGFEVEGTDLSEYAKGVIQQRLGLDIHMGELESLSLPSGHYDVVSNWDTLEHVVNPRALLQEMRRITRPDGVLVLRTINEETILVAVANVFYRMGIRGAASRMHEPYHLYYFTRPLLAQLLSECGFAPMMRFDCEIDVERLGLGFIGRSAMRVTYKLQSLFKREFAQLVIAKAQ
jgi:ubiquinone/menaquinone biosynthesis C-methylase UbiE